ncbi:hypothetical protein SY89_00599 [Halolamina pelagica]|uniref:Uncharacterized protein n=1 Tax=Halolamina pelagica TaxID=699431 RepID=A0A0P7G985_9EURY|nr:hypothetical protein [Halolamina pelagica]KPN29879.1 hypothetical protein SY89_00599 [Halolamina pelagica]
MPARRSFLLAAGLTAIGGLGWLGVEHVSVTGEVKRKYIDVSWESQGRQRYGRVLWSALAPDEAINVSYASSYAADAVQSPRAITVDEELDSRLHAEFSSVTYRLGVAGTALGGSGYSLKGVDREGFNGAQLGDTATVANLGDRLAVYDVETRPDWSNSSSVSTFDFAEKYPSFQ